MTSYVSLAAFSLACASGLQGGGAEEGNLFEIHLHHFPVFLSYDLLHFIPS